MRFMQHLLELGLDVVATVIVAAAVAVPLGILVGWLIEDRRLVKVLFTYLSATSALAFSIIWLISRYG